MIDLSKSLDKNKFYILGVSGGPDSMALLDMCIRQGFFIGVVHMNYHKRDTALRDQKIVENYCKLHNIQCHICDYQKNNLHNFQADARNARYHAYKKYYEANNASALLLAHQKDDDLETYLMQKQSHRLVKYYGIAQSTQLFQMLVIRPLLQLTKQDLLKYCQQYQVPFGIDESNLSNTYTRNYLRNTYLTFLSAKDKEDLFKEKQAKNKELMSILSCFKIENFQLKFMQSCNFSIQALAVRYLLLEYQPNLANKKTIYYENMLKSLMNKGIYSLGNNYYLIYDSKLIEFVECKPIQQVVIHDLTPKVYEGFRISKTGSKRQAFNAYNDELPLIVRGVKEGDWIETSFGRKKISRWFIDQKIHPILRLKTKVIVNNCGKVIFVSGFGCETSHYLRKEKLYMVE